MIKPVGVSRAPSAVVIKPIALIIGPPAATIAVRVSTAVFVSVLRSLKPLIALVTNCAILVTSGSKAAPSSIPALRRLLSVCWNLKPELWLTFLKPSSTIPVLLLMLFSTWA